MTRYNLLIEYTAWSVWSACPASCGATGIKKRTRLCLHKGKPSNACVGNSEEDMPCPENPCPSRFGMLLMHEHDKIYRQSLIGFSSWSSWTDCSKTCGTGSQARVRECINGELGVKECPSDKSAESRVGSQLKHLSKISCLSS